MPTAGYISVDKDQVDHPGIYDVVDAILDSREIQFSTHDDNGTGDVNDAVVKELLRSLTVGALVRLWCYADRHLRANNTLPLSVTGCEQVMGLPEGWLRFFPERWVKESSDGTVELPNYIQKNHLITKGDRIQTKAAARMQKLRERRRNENGTGAPRDDNCIDTGTGTGTGPYPLSPNPGPVPVKSASRGAAPKGGGARRQSPDGSTWVSASPPIATGPAKSFDDEFKARFGVTPDEAHEMRKPKPPEGQP